MASPGSQHCAKCIGTLSFHIESHLGLLKHNSGIHTGEKPYRFLTACTVWYKQMLQFWKHQSVKFDFTADLTGTGNRSEEVIK